MYSTSCFIRFCYVQAPYYATCYRTRSPFVEKALEQGKIKDAAVIMDCLHWWHFTKETHALAALVYYKAGRIDEAKEHLAMICKPRNMLFLYLASNAKLKTLFDELKKHNE